MVISMKQNVGSWDCCKCCICTSERCVENKAGVRCLVEKPGVDFLNVDNDENREILRD